MTRNVRLITLLSIIICAAEHPLVAQSNAGGDATPERRAPVVGVKADSTSGTAGYLGVFTNSTDLGNSIVFQNGSTISVGGTTSLGAMTLIGNVPSGDSAGMALYNSGGGGGSSVSLDMYNTNANGGIPQAKIKAIDDGNFSDNLTFWTKTPGAATNSVTEKMRITSTGNVGIGTNNPQHPLHVFGTIGATEVIVSNTGADYVFQPDYRLRPLAEVKQYIQLHHHLPEIPSALEVSEKGMSLGDMQAKLLAKVEELTLHMIRAEEENRELRARLATLESERKRSR